MYVSMERLLAMRSMDAIMSDDGATVRDCIPQKKRYMLRHCLYFTRLLWSFLRWGQTAPLAIGRDEDTGEDYLVNGHHRVILCHLVLRWRGMHTTSCPEDSVDRAWDRAHRRELDYW
jgi:hypothetical protein